MKVNSDEDDMEIFEGVSVLLTGALEHQQERLISKNESVSKVTV